MTQLTEAQITAVREAVLTHRRTRDQATLDQQAAEEYALYLIRREASGGGARDDSMARFDRNTRTLYAFIAVVFGCVLALTFPGFN